MRHDTGWQSPRLDLVAMLLAAGLACWLLLSPELIRGLPLALRLPLIALGVWALGAAFLRPLGLEPHRHWLRCATTPPWSLVVLGVFAALLLLRALLA